MDLAPCEDGRATPAFLSLFLLTASFFERMIEKSAG